jgi:hypothetical protein
MAHTRGLVIKIKEGGENNETLYDPKSCSLRKWALTIVPGMTLNCPNNKWNAARYFFSILFHIKS